MQFKFSIGLTPTRASIGVGGCVAHQMQVLLLEQVHFAMLELGDEDGDDDFERILLAFSSNLITSKP